MKSDGNENAASFSAVVLAGGNSVRMGYPKPWLRYGHSTFLGRIVAVFRQFGIKDVVVVLNEKYAAKRWRKELDEIEPIAAVTINNEAEKGRLFSVKLGLEMANSEFTFIHNVDNPFIEYNILKQLINNLEINGTTIPSFNGRGGHPVIINSVVKNEIVNNCHNYKRLKDVFINFPKKYIPVNSNCILKNINTPQELEANFNELV